MSRTEARVWQRLRAKQTSFHFTRQLPIGPYFADFALRRLKLVVEIDGDRHDVERDSRRDSFLKEQGWEVVRIPVTEVDDDLDRVVCWIYDACVARQAHLRKPADDDSS